MQAGQPFLLHPATVCLKRFIVQKMSSLGYDIHIKKGRMEFLNLLRWEKNPIKIGIKIKIKF